MHDSTTLDVTAIELSKAKIVLLLLISCSFVALGFWMLSLDEATILAQRRFNTPLFVRGIAGVSIVLFGTFGLLALRKLFDTKPGIVFSNLGVLDNSSMFSAGLVPWEEITGFDVYATHRHKMLVIFVTNPSKYIQVGGIVRRYLIRSSAKMSGSPVAIAPNTLKVTFDELHGLFMAYFSKYAKRSQP